MVSSRSSPVLMSGVGDTKSRSVPTSWFPKSDVSDENFISQGLSFKNATPERLSEQIQPGISEIEKTQKWLDKNPIHPDRQRRIKELLLHVAEADCTLPPYLLIKGVFVDGSDNVPVSGGNFADVFRGVYGQQAVAVKRFRAFLSHDNDGKAKLYKRFRREAIIWHQLRHPRILTFMGVDYAAYMSRTALCMISPWIEKGTLMEYLKNAGGAPVKHQCLVTDIASGLAYLHAQSFAHGDLHGSNVFIDDQNRALLADFGLTAIYEMTHLATTTINKAGACRWLSPELSHQDDGPPPQKTMSGDMFAFGRLCLSVYTRLVPFHTISNDMFVFLKVVQNLHPPRPSLDECHGTAIPDELWDLIERCWDVTPEKRPTVVEAQTELNHIQF